MKFQVLKQNFMPILQLIIEKEYGKKLKTKSYYNYIITLFDSFKNFVDLKFFDEN